MDFRDFVGYPSVMLHLRARGFAPLTRALGNFLCTLALPEVIKQWSLTTLCQRLVKIGAKIVRHGRSVIFQMVEVGAPRALFQDILSAIASLRPSRPARC